MMAQALEFEASVARAGYYWAGTAGTLVPKELLIDGWQPGWIFEKAGATRGGVISRCPDKLDPILYRTFATLGSEVASVVDFVSRWGYLEYNRALPNTASGQHRDVSRQVLTSSGIAYTESVEFWREESAKLAHAIAVHEAIHSGDPGWLTTRLRFKAESRDQGHVTQPSWWFRSHTPSDEKSFQVARAFLERGQMVIQTAGARAWAKVHLPAPRERDDPRKVATAWLNQRITAELRLEPERGVWFGSDDRGDRQGLCFCPIDLRALMWWQFARSIANGTESRACKECGRWFALTLKDRDRKFFCSDTCKMKEFRNRKKQAADLHATGDYTADGIAGVVGSDPETVRKWLGLPSQVYRPFGQE